MGAWLDNFFNKSLYLRLILLLPLFNSIFSPVNCATIEEKCQSCRLLVASFEKGLKETAKAHFGGGNTAWEENSLGKYKTSETRLVEIVETNLCQKKDDYKDILGDLFKEAKDQCHSLNEEFEEDIENWYFHKQKSDPNFLKWLCINKLELCCEFGQYGKDCSLCPGELVPCSARGTCQGNGTRSGNGKCKCDIGYQGNLCRQCASGYFSIKDSNPAQCESCDSSCKGDCKSGGPIGCLACKVGYTLKQGFGCSDIDECNDEVCDDDKFEICKNTVGSFVCECKDGFKREDELCVEDIAAKNETENVDIEDKEDKANIDEILNAEVEDEQKTEL